jgi:hypothetical protein
VGLKFYSTAQTTFEITVNVAAVESSNVEVEFWSKMQSQSYTYYIGIENAPIKLKQYFYVQGGYRIASIEASQTSGTLPSKFY